MHNQSDPRSDKKDVPCRLCGEKTRMTATELCDWCYNLASCLNNKIRNVKVRKWLLKRLAATEHEHFTGRGR